MNEKVLHQDSFSQTRNRLNPARMTGIGLLLFSVVALTVSYFYSSSILSMIGLGIMVWGILLLYIQTDEYVKRTLMDAVTDTSLETVSKMLKELGYQGKPWYPSPAHFKDPEANKVYIAKTENILPKKELIQAAENQISLQSQEGVLIEAPGAGLNKLFEKTLGTSFMKVDLAYLERNLPKLIVNNLEIARELELEKVGDTIRVTMNDCVLKSGITDPANPALVYEGLGSPIASAIACAIAKATGMAVSIASEHHSDNSKDIEVQYKLLAMEK